MLKNVTLFFLLVSFFSVTMIAQNKEAKPLKMDEPASVTKTTQNTGSPVTAADFVKVAIMPNTYGPASGDINPLVYDPVSNIVALVHRWNENGLGSGQLKWAYSTDDGATYTASSTTVQEGFLAEYGARYPSMALHNPSNSSNVEDLWAAFAWPDLYNDGSGGAFGDIGYGVSLGLEETGFAAYYTDPPSWSTRQPVFSDGQYIYWPSDNSEDNDIYLFKTADFASLEVTMPFAYGGFPMGGVARDGKIYIGFASPFSEDGSGLWHPGYSVSEDQGVTWSEPMYPDFTSFTDYDEMWDADSTDGFVSYAADIQVDGNGYVHLIAGVADTNTFGEGGSYAIVEFYETASGWEYKEISPGLDYVPQYNNGDSPGLGQTVYNCNLSTNQAGDVYVATWVYAEAPDTLCDVYMSFRAEGQDWSTPMNLTQTPEMNENGTHLANMLKDNGDNSYLAFAGYWYEDGSTTAPPDLLAPTAFYVAPVEILVTSVDDNELVNTFSLQQNYPNPFNPTTTIKYSVPELTNVSLKVYDVLGKEVATLVDAEQVGSQAVDFDASNLASGLYIYTIKAGSFTSSKKMMLLK